MSQTKAELIKGLNINASAPATALQIDASGNVNIDSNTLYVDATNNRVGIGTSSPQDKLAVAGVNGNFTEASIRVNGSSGATNGDSGLRLYANCNTGTKNWIIAAGYGTANVLEITPSTVDGGATYSTPTAVFTSTGRVGIGTTSPSSKLSIATAANSPALDITDASTSDFIITPGVSSGVCRVGPATGAMALYTGNSERARIDSSGRLLVGTSTATAITDGNVFAQLEVEGTTTATSAISIIRNSNDTNAGGLIIVKSRGTAAGSNTLVGDGDSLGFIQFQGADGTQKRIGAIIAATADAATGSNDLPTRLTFSTTADGASSPTERMRISSTGGVRLPDVYNQTIALSANVFIDTDGTLKRATSSIKYKTNIETLEDQYADAVLNCRPVWYQSTSTGDNPNWGFWGFIAEEVAEIDPRLVQWKTVEQVVNEDGSRETVPLDAPEPENVAYDRFVPHLLNLIKRQGEAIVDLQAEVAALKAQ